MVVAGTVVCVMALDWGHAWWVERRYAAWESGIERDDDGVRANFAPWTLGSGDRALLFIHGFAGSPDLFKAWGTYFADRNYTCHAIRLPGFGVPVAAAANVTAEEWRATIHEAVQQLRSSHDEVWIVAHSLGATLALQVAVAEPGLVDGLCLMAPLLEISAQRSPLLAPGTWFKLGRRIMRRTTFVESMLPVDAHDPQLASVVVRDRFIPWAIYDSLFEVLADLPPAADLAHLPIWVALADSDEIIDNAAAQAWFTELPQVNKVLITTDTAGHVLPQDTGWEELREAMKQFMAMIDP